VGNFLTRWEPVSFSSRTLLLAVRKLQSSAPAIEFSPSPRSESKELLLSAWTRSNNDPWSLQTVTSPDVEVRSVKEGTVKLAFLSTIARVAKVVVHCYTNFGCKTSYSDPPPPLFVLTSRVTRVATTSICCSSIVVLSVLQGNKSVHSVVPMIWFLFIKFPHILYDHLGPVAVTKIIAVRSACVFDQ